MTRSPTQRNVLTWWADRQVELMAASATVLARLAEGTVRAMTAFLPRPQPVAGAQSRPPTQTAAPRLDAESLESFRPERPGPDGDGEHAVPPITADADGGDTVLAETTDEPGAAEGGSPLAAGEPIATESPAAPAADAAAEPLGPGPGERPAIGLRQPLGIREWEAPAGGGAEFPVQRWDELSLGSIRARLRRLSEDDVATLRRYEETHAGRPAVLSMLTNRIAKLRAASDAGSGGRERD